MTSLLSKIVAKIAPVYPQAKRWLHSFNGGIFPQYHKELSANQPIREIIIPNKLILPLQQPVGQPAELLVEVGSQVKKNQLIARSSKDGNKALVVPIHAPTSGTVVAIENHMLPHPSGLQDMTIIIEPDNQNAVIENALQVSGDHPKNPIELKEIIFNAGIIGMGGAGFPTYAKLPKEKGIIHTLLLNGAECEPFITCDDVLMQQDAQEIIQGALITAQALGAEKILCGIESNKPSAIKAMKQAAQNSIVQIIEVQTVYPMGGQKQLTQELTGIEMPQKAHAVDVGMLMMNVATYRAIYRAVTLGEPLTSRMVSVTGLGLEKPFNTRAMIGTPFSTLAQAASPKTSLNYPLVMGGPMMGFKVQQNDVPVIKTTNCILANPPEPTEMQMPCIRCGECMDACPINLLPQQMYWHSQAREFDKVEKLNVFDCIECGCCSYVCPSHIPLVQYYRNAKSEIKEIHAEEQAVELAKQRHEFKLARIEREKQEREARLKAKKEAVKKQAAKDNSSEKSKVKPAASAAAAAKAAAAKRAAAKAGGEIPAARKKAIEAAKKAASQGSAEKASASSEQKGSEGKKDPRAAAKKAAMAAAKKRAQTKNTDNETASDTTIESTETKAKDPKAAAKAAAMAAAKRRAQAKKQQTEDNTSAEQLDSSEKTTPIEETNKDPKAAAKSAARAAAMAAAKKRASKKAQQAEANMETEQDSIPADVSLDAQTTDLTENTPETPASKKEEARKAAMNAARAAAKKRQQAKQLSDRESSNSEETKQESQPGTQSSSESSVEDDSTETKKQRAMRLAREAAAKRAAKKQAEKLANSDNESEDNS